MELRDLRKCRCWKSTQKQQKERNCQDLFQTVYSLVPISVPLFRGHGMQFVICVLLMTAPSY